VDQGARPDGASKPLKLQETPTGPGNQQFFLAGRRAYEELPQILVVKKPTGMPPAGFEPALRP
jgi:hypothetical protein